MASPAQIVPILPSTSHLDRLLWMCHTSPPRNLPKAYYFCVDSVPHTQDLVYEPFCNDFGPLNLAMVVRYCRELQRLLANPDFSTYRIYHYTSTDPVKRVNAAFLICAYEVIVRGKTGMEAWGPFLHLEPFPDYRDASFGGCSYKCTLLHCLRGLEIGIKLGWLDYERFNLEEYEKLEKIENGDMNWIIPGKMLAFSCPSVSAVDESGLRCFTPEDYGPEFKRLGVSSVVRLNKTTYESTVSSHTAVHSHGLQAL